LTARSTAFFFPLFPLFSSFRFRRIPSLAIRPLRTLPSCSGKEKKIPSLSFICPPPFPSYGQENGRPSLFLLPRMPNKVIYFSFLLWLLLVVVPAFSPIPPPPLPYRDKLFPPVRAPQSLRRRGCAPVRFPSPPIHLARATMRFFPSSCVFLRCSRDAFFATVGQHSTGFATLPPHWRSTMSRYTLFSLDFLHNHPWFVFSTWPAVPRPLLLLSPLRAVGTYTGEVPVSPLEVPFFCSRKIKGKEFPRPFLFCFS